MQTETAIAIANARPAAGLLSPRNFRLGYEDLMNALMSFLVNTLTLEAVIGCFFLFPFPFPFDRLVLRSSDPTCDS